MNFWVCRRLPLLHKLCKHKLGYQAFFAQAMSTGKVKVAVCQMTSTADKSENLIQGRRLIEECIKQNVKVVFLPEGFDCIEASKEQAIAAGESLDGPTISAYRSLAAANNVWLSLGGFKEKSDTDTRIYNTHIVIDSKGEIAGTYSKLHLFDVDIPGKVKLCESDVTLPGRKISDAVASPAGNIGLCICYDLRFPELSTILRLAGADILTYPSAFTVATGKAHWEVLLRARAVENQCYVIAAAQVGQHNAKRASYGHSMVIDPWGKVLCKVEDGIGIATADIDLDQLGQVRTSMPIPNHRRCDIYSLNKTSTGVRIDDTPIYMFAQIQVPSSAVFYRTELSFAFVNKKPVLPGHMLVSPLRVVKQFTELTSVETADLFEVVKKVGDAVKQEFNAESLTVSIQDGPDAGQSVEHLHVHILPRRKGDFARNDEVYEKLFSHDKQEDGTLFPADSPLWRSEDTMSKEATKMRKYFDTT